MRDANGGADGRREPVLRAIYALCLLGATLTHARTLVRHGLLWDYGGVPWASAAFWTALTILDPLAILLLFARPNAGVAATAAIIVADVAHNLWIGSRQASFLGSLAEPRLREQIAFMLFVMVTAPYAWMRRKGDG